MTTLLEKYRPKRLDDIIGQDAVIRSIKTQLELKPWDLPHYTFYGPPGSGKTTTAECIATELYGEDWDKIGVVKVINASAESGIDTVREDIKKFCRTSSAVHDFPRKLVILDEFDHFNQQSAQPALRRPMELYSSNVHFILIGNFVNRILAPIRSRGAQLRFVRATKENIIEYLERVAIGEDVDIDYETMELIASNSRGDYRTATHIMDMSIQLEGIQKIVTSDNVLDTFKLLTEDSIIQIYNLITEGSTNDAIHEIDSYLASGILPETIIQELFEHIRFKGDLNPTIAKLFSDTTTDIATTAIPYIVFTYFVTKLAQLLTGVIEDED